jgi:protein phosphatase
VAVKEWLLSRWSLWLRVGRDWYNHREGPWTREYLRIIYGPEYALPENLRRLKSRGLGAKRTQIALGLEALERFVHQEPLRRVHECVFGVLALESEPVDPRL